MQRRHFMVPAVYTIMKDKQNRVLAILRKNTGYMDGHWGTPAGHVEKGELPLKAAIREVKEETGLIVDVDSLKFLHVMVRPKNDKTGERVDFYFGTDSWTGEPTNIEPDKHAKVDWVDINDSNIKWMPYQKQALIDIQNGIQYSEWK